MTRKELRAYRTEDRGEFAIGEFKAEATWRESGDQEWLDAGGQWIKGIKRRVRLDVELGKIDADQDKALREILFNLPESQDTIFNISLKGEPHSGLYLHGVRAQFESGTPRGLIFSSEIP